MHVVAYHPASDPMSSDALLDAVIESDLDLAGLLRPIVRSATGLTGARLAALGVLDQSGSGLSEFVYFGVDEAVAEAIGHPPQGHGVLGLLITDPRPIRVARLAEHPATVGLPAGHPPIVSFLGVPILIRNHVGGSLYLADKAGGAGFTEEDEQLVVTLAAAAGIAIDNARLHARVRQLTLAEDRERIARDLHDTVIQRVYAVALSLQIAEGLAGHAALAARLHSAANDLDETIRQIRTTIFALEPPPTAEGGLRLQALEVRDTASRGLGFEPDIRFGGLVDLVPDQLGGEVLATLREALTNVARHAQATQAQIVLEVSAHELHLQVTDDGVGPPPPSGQPGNGLLNMAARAETLGGSFNMASGPGGGTHVDWRVPLS